LLIFAGFKKMTMTGRNVLKGVFLVAMGAASYGMLATFVKLAYKDIGVTGNPYTPAEVVSSQFLIGILVLFGINGYSRVRKHKSEIEKASPLNIRNLIITGTSTGLTSIFYYLAVIYIPVSIGIVLLMQTVWMGVLLEWMLEKKRPSTVKLISVLIVLTGTAMATNLLTANTSLDWRGVVLGLMAAASFTTTMFASNRVAVHISPAQRSLYMLFGGALVVAIFTAATQNQPFNYDIFFKWGILIALFGTVIPPMLLNAGFPLTGIGLGSIVAALELPVSVMMAFVLLGEQVVLTQWLGIILIILAIVLMNISVSPGGSPSIKKFFTKSSSI
jgi:drug/metabolite transporter (DMT)-like permease